MAVKQLKVTAAKPVVLQTCVRAGIYAVFGSDRLFSLFGDRKDSKGVPCFRVQLFYGNDDPPPADEMQKLWVKTFNIIDKLAKENGLPYKVRRESSAKKGGTIYFNKIG